MNICRDAFNGYTAKINKSTKCVIMETLLIFMVIPRKINFTQLERYGNRLSKSGKYTPNIGYFWSGLARAASRV